MRLGKAINPSHHASVVPADAPATSKDKMKYAVAAAAPVAAVVLGSILSAKSENPPKNARRPNDHPEDK
jgi:hypothetical protein